jgi:hypothetical protein
VVTTIRVVGRTNTFKTKGRMFKDVDMGLMRARHEPKLCIVIISVKGAELSEAMRSVRP